MALRICIYYFSEVNFEEEAGILSPEQNLHLYPFSLWPNFDSINNLQIHRMGIRRKPAILPKLTSLLALLVHRASMTVNTLQIIAFQTISARRHPAHISQSIKFHSVWLVVMIMRAGFVRAIIS